MVKHCVISSCLRTRKSGVALHKFPDDNRSKQAWIDFVRIQNPNWDGPTEVSYICSNHFSEDSYGSNYILKEETGLPCRRRLKEGAIPTMIKKEESLFDVDFMARMHADSRSCSPALDSEQPSCSRESIGSPVPGSEENTNFSHPGFSGEIPSCSNENTSTSFPNAEDSETPVQAEEKKQDMDVISAETGKLSIDQEEVRETEALDKEVATSSLALFQKQLAEFPESPSRRKEPIILNICDLNAYITCALCGGYLYEASTITECMHTFCKTCLVRHAEKNLTCPTCDTIMHPTDPFVHIRHDSTIQDIEQRREKEFYEEHERKTGEVIIPKLQLPPPPPATPPPRPMPIMPPQMKRNRGRGVMHYNSQFVSLLLEFSGEFEGYRDDAMELDLEKRFVRVTNKATVGNVANFIKKKLRLDNVYTVELMHKLGEDEDEVIIDTDHTLGNMRDELYQGQDCIMELQYKIRAS
ncbi:hypothetical protein KUTeg_005245 [Tegillarca granosa]|uniref:RING-type domain-containing protein n=1 Tax=Tegillarca granosa TaxID=220873 RepID=A0ABQ9FKX6_TEGGR|nr:hypothetical protein KUTeg_005245 [Tegillarca granosa]